MFRNLMMFAVLVVALATSMPSMAQEAPPATGGLVAPMLDAAPAPVPAPAVVEAPGRVGDVTPIMTTIKDTIVAVLLALLTAAGGWLSTLAGKWFKGVIDVNAVAANVQWEGYARTAVDKAFNYALKRVGTSWDGLHDLEVRGAVLQYALQFLVSQYPEVVKWIDTNNNGVIDWVETHLPVTVPFNTVPDTASTSTGKVAQLFAAPTARPTPRKVVTPVPETKAPKRQTRPVQTDPMLGMPT